jgi:hypothetical protein
MKYLDEPLGIPLDELGETFRHSLRDLLRSRGCPGARLDGAVRNAYLIGANLFEESGGERLTRRLYSDVVEAAVSQAMKNENLIS